MVQKLIKAKLVLKVGKIGNKYDILKVQETNTKRSLEMNPWKTEIEARWLKAAKNADEKLIEKGKKLLSGIG